jgi:N-methylhydantoinase B
MMRKSWNFSLMQSESLVVTLERLLEPLGTSAFVLADGRSLLVRPSNPADLATLPLAASLCQQYLRLGDGEVAILNDPFSGGTHLGDLTLICGVAIDAKVGDVADLLLVRRLELTARVSGRNFLDDEGVRIPPTPIVSHGVLNKDLLEAIATHPLTPPGFFARVESAIGELLQTARETKSVAADPMSELTSAGFKRLLADSSRVFQTLMGRLPLGTTTVSSQLETGETVKLSLEVSEGRILFNFTGTDSSTALGLTEHATSGACLAAIAAAMSPDPGRRLSLPLNAGAFEHIQVSTPAKTLLSSRAPSGMFRGMNQGVALVAELVASALAALNPNLKSAASAGHDGFIQVAFADGRFYSRRITPGAGATREHIGASAWATWGSLFTNKNCFEESERGLPLVWTLAGLRAGSGGKGKKLGGDGAMLGFTVKAGAKLRWVLGDQARRHSGLDGGHSGLPAQVVVIRLNGAREEFDQAEGEVSLEAGDQVQVLASGGGGSGEPPTPSPSKDST